MPRSRKSLVLFGVLAHLPVLAIAWVFMPLGFYWDWVVQVGGPSAEGFLAFVVLTGFICLIVVTIWAWGWALLFASDATWLQRYEHLVWILIIVVSGALGPAIFFWAQVVPTVDRGGWSETSPASPTV